MCCRSRSKPRSRFPRSWTAVRRGRGAAPDAHTALSPRRMGRPARGVASVLPEPELPRVARPIRARISADDGTRRQPAGRMSRPASSVATPLFRLRRCPLGSRTQVPSPIRARQRAQGGDPGRRTTESPRSRPETRRRDFETGWRARAPGRREAGGRVTEGKRVGRPPRRVDLEELRRLRAQGLSIRQIARRMRISSSTIAKRLRELPPSAALPALRNGEVAHA